MMFFLKKIILVFALMLISVGAFAKGEKAGEFDFYVLALSWSPSFCATEGRFSGEPQCELNSNYGFVVHGLWPQNERGYPEFCPTTQKTWLDKKLIESIQDIMPSRSLVIYQWRKHGQCSGLSAQDYFALIRRAYETVQLPDGFDQSMKRDTETPETIEEKFLGSNASMTKDEIAITCDRRHFKEVRICLTKDLQPRGCEEVDANSCHRSKVIIPAIE